jgi:ATP-dependent helicase/nuclease subunit B
LTIIDRAIETGGLAAAPDERACTWCDFRPVCGPREEERIGRKAPGRLADLEALRAMR